MPSVTVIIPYKDNLGYLFDALKSAFKQNYKNFKIIIVYDNENKSDLYKIKNFLKIKKNKYSKTLKIIVNKKNLGAGYSRNVGIKNSNTKYVAFLDSDDLWAKNKLKTQINFMEKNKQVFSHSSYFVINPENQIVSSRTARPKIYFNDLIKSCDIGLSTVILNLNFIKKNNYFFPKIKTKEDFVLWLRIITKLRILKGLNKKLSYYRKTKNSLSSNKFLSLVNGYRVYRNYMNFGYFKSIYYLIILSLNFLKKSI